jgi:hypothetical protein
MALKILSVRNARKIVVYGAVSRWLHATEPYYYRVAPDGGGANLIEP